MNKYILTVNDYIENYQVGNAITLTDNQKLYLANSITGSTVINSKYDSTTDSFIEPTKVNTIEASTDSYYDDNNEKDIEYFTGSLPVTLSFNNNITSTNPPPTGTVNIEHLSRIPFSGSISIEELEINNSNLQFKVEPIFFSESIDWNVVDDTEVIVFEEIELRISPSSLDFNSVNDRILSNNNPYRIKLAYSSSFQDPSV